MKHEMMRDIQKWQCYAILYSALTILSALSALLGGGGLVLAILNRQHISPWCWGGLAVACLLALTAAAFRRFLWGKGVRHWKADVQEMRFEPFSLKTPFVGREELQGQLRAAVGLRRLKHVERAWYGVEQKRKRTRVFLLDYTGEQGYSASDVTGRVKRCYERLDLSRPKVIGEARRCERVFFLVFDRLPEAAMEEARMNAIEWTVDDCDQGYPFGECTVRAYFELSSGRLYLPRFVSDQAVLIGDYRYCVQRILEWLAL